MPKNHESPKATLIHIEPKEKIAVVTLKIEGDITPPYAPAYLKKQGSIQSAFIARTVKRDGDTITFEIEKIDIPLKENEIYLFNQLWSTHQLKTAKSDPNQWKKQYFKANSSIKIQRDGYVMTRKLQPSDNPENYEIIEGGWDHEHCFLCWETISEDDKNPTFGYVNKNEWLCEVCYEKYIASGYGKSLGDFLE